MLLYILFVFLFHKIKFVGVRKGDKGLTGGVSLEPFPWQGDFLLFVPIFKKGRVFFLSKDLGLQNAVKATAVVSFSPNKGQVPSGS